MNYFIFLYLFFLGVPLNLDAASPIDRYALVHRHSVIIKKMDSLSSLSVGNGKFAFTVDPTGFQSFPSHYERGVPLGTQSEWGWHSFPNREHYGFDETFKEYDFHGKKINYSVQGHSSDRKNKATEYFRSNPHRLQLANIGLEIEMKSGAMFQVEDISSIEQTLDLWEGMIHSRFSVDGHVVKVITAAHPTNDAVSFKIESDLLQSHKIKIRVRIPAPNGAWKDAGTLWQYGPGQTSTSHFNRRVAQITSIIDSTQYLIRLHWKHDAQLIQKAEQYYILDPAPASSFELTIGFDPNFRKTSNPSYNKTIQASKSAWKKFWMSGGAIDLSESTDSRAFELERRIILSQYLTRIQCASANPPQETGLTFNSWYGKPHMEMHWWHSLHFALWGRPELLEQSLQWYLKNVLQAQALATRQGYKGVRWPKMTDPEGQETPSSVGSFLIWQQPHIIYFSELLYKINPSQKVLTRYRELINSTAEFMVDYLSYDSLGSRYVLGPGLIPAQESFSPLTTINPTYELAYLRWALNVAQSWRTRTGLSREARWDEVISKLSALPQKDSTYLACESAPDSYIDPRHMTDHPAVLGAVAGLPIDHSIDTGVMKNTFLTIWQKWDWASTWGWDYPMMAMAATRLNMPQYALEAILMRQQKNTYLINGHNYQTERLPIYLPGNGGLLAVIAMMCTGVEGKQIESPGFPKNGAWKVRWEGLNKIF